MGQFDCPTFPQLLRRLEEGDLERDLNDRYQKLVKEIEACARGSGGKASGEISLKLKLAYDNGMVTVSAGLSDKLPEQPRLKTRMYPMPGGRGLTLQPELPMAGGLRDVSAARDAVDVGHVALKGAGAIPAAE